MEEDTHGLRELFHLLKYSELHVSMFSLSGLANLFVNANLNTIENLVLDSITLNNEYTTAICP